MTRTWGRLITAAGLLAVVAALSAQSGRDAYREAFRDWRQADPDLERDAATSPDLSQRTGTNAAAAARYSTARAAYLRAAVAEANQSMDALNASRLTPQTDLAPAVDLQKLVAASTELVTKQIGTYADDPDPGLQPVRQALTRERSALLALSGAVSERQAAVTKAGGAWVAVEQARVHAVEPHQAVLGALQGESSAMEQETLAWAEYYRLLAEAARAPSATPPASTTSAATPATTPSAPLPDAASPNAVVTGGVRINNPARNPANAGGGAGASAAVGPAVGAAVNPSAGPLVSTGPAISDAAASAGVRINNPAGNPTPRINNPAPAPVAGSSMNRFVGSWTFPMGGLYHGPEPDVADLEVKEDGGNLTGKLNARFWPFGDIKAVTTVRFEFSGAFGTGRVQSFPLVTSDGAKGSIDLIPGPAFNLLEINYYTDRVPGKLTRGNLLLIRK
jgi:hypothetical protein